MLGTALVVSGCWTSFLIVISELVYLLLEHVVINDDLEFCLWDMSRHGGSWLF